MAAHRVVELVTNRSAEQLDFDEAEALRLITDNLPVLIAYFDRQRRFQFSNRAHREWWGFHQEEIVGRHMSEVLGKEIYEETLPHVTQALAGERVTFEVWNTYPGAGRRYVRVDYIPDKKSSGAVLGAFVLVSDITKTKLQQEELLRQERERQIIFDTVPAMIWYKDAENRILQLNKPAAESVGAPVAELRGASTYDLYPTEASQYHQDDLRVIRSGAPQIGIVEPITVKNNERRWLRTDKFPYRNEEGEITGVIVFSIDISEQRRAEEALRESEARLRQLLESTKVIPWESGAHSNCFTYVGPQAEALLGFPMTRWYEPDFWANRLPAEMRQQIVASYLDKGATLNEFEIEYPMLAADDRRVWVRDVVHVVRNDLGEPIIHRGFLFDITASKLAEVEKARLEEALRQSQKLEALGTLAGGIAHDFNNILGGIIGYTELALNETSAHSLLSQNLNQVLAFSHRAKDLVRQILSFSRKQHIERSSCCVRTIAEEVLALARPSLPAHTVLTKEYPISDLYVHTNPTHLHQILLNLVTNAGYAAREAAGEITLRIEARTPDRAFLQSHPGMTSGEYVVLAVRDCGKGMSEEVMRRIFEPYFTTKPFGEGSGLGLSVAHGLVSSYGGCITVASKVGVGTTFEVYLPRTAPPAGENAPPAETTRAIRARILFLDDEKTLASLGSQILERLGHEVQVCTSARQALQLITEAPDRFDLLITDQAMPEMEGVELAQCVSERAPTLPIILCSGLAPQISDLRGKFSIRQILAKPYGVQSLRDAVVQALRNTSSQQSHK